jgi:hypothetical protein
MELWLLGAGAVLLIAITIWIVWPATSRAEEGPMHENATRNIPPQGDRFEDQYTAATADLSVGGVASAVGAMQDEPSSQPVSYIPEPPRPVVPPTAAPAPTPTPTPTHTQRSLDLSEPRTIGVGAGLLLTAGGALGGAWLYSRWLAERNKPINRLRRGARDVASRINQRLPDNVDLSGNAAPMGGIASAVVVSSLLLARALRREERPTEVDMPRTQRLARDLFDSTRYQTAPLAAELTRAIVQEVLDRGRTRIDRMPETSELRHALMDRLSGIDTRPAREMQRRVQKEQKRAAGIGMSGMAAIGAAALVIWRLMSRSASRAQWPSATR